MLFSAITNFFVLRPFVLLCFSILCYFRAHVSALVPLCPFPLRNKLHHHHHHQQGGAAAELKLSGQAGSVMPVVRADTWPRNLPALPKGWSADSVIMWATGNGSASCLSSQNSLQMHMRVCTHRKVASTLSRLMMHYMQSPHNS